MSRLTSARYIVKFYTPISKKEPRIILGTSGTITLNHYTMSSSKTPSTSYWEQADLELSNHSQESLPAYTERTTIQTPSSSSKASASTSSKVKSAVWSYLKGELPDDFSPALELFIDSIIGDVYKHHPAFSQERRLNALMKASTNENTGKK